ncbi:MAG: ROK family protein [Bacteroidota bacterium]
MSLIFGIDLGGTKTEGIVLDSSQQYAQITRIRIPTERDKGYTHILDNIEGLLNRLSESCGQSPKKLGIGTPGAFDPSTQTIKNSNTTCLIGQPLKKDLQDRLGMEVRFANDANCFALAETKMGIIPEMVPNAEVVFGIILGTGVGGGIVIRGQILQGLHNIGGEWGHNFLDVSGGKCYCGRSGCVETILSGPALEAYYHTLSQTKRKLADIYKRHVAGIDAHATNTIRRLIAHFGKALGPVINLIDPQAVVIGGGLGNIGLLYSEGRNEVAKYVFNSRMETRILKPKLGDSAGVLGAALLVES